MNTELLVGCLADGVVIRVVGQGTMQTSAALREIARANLDHGLIVFDATQCDYLDSTFLGTLIGIQKLCEQSPHRRFVIAASESTRVKLFSLSSLHQYFDFVDVAPAPVGELEPVDVRTLDPKALGRHVMQCHRRLADRGGDQAAAFRSIADRLSEELGEDDGGD